MVVKGIAGKMPIATRGHLNVNVIEVSMATQTVLAIHCHAKGVAERMLYVRTAHAYVPPDVLVIHTPDVSMYNDTYLFAFTLK